MKYAIARGLIFKELKVKQSVIAIRTEISEDFKTLSLSNEDDLMLQIVITPEVKKLLKRYLRIRG